MVWLFWLFQHSKLFAYFDESCDTLVEVYAVVTGGYLYAYARLSLGYYG